MKLKKLSAPALIAATGLLAMLGYAAEEICWYRASDTDQGVSCGCLLSANWSCSYTVYSWLATCDCGGSLCQQQWPTTIHIGFKGVFTGGTCNGGSCGGAYTSSPVAAYGAYFVTVPCSGG